MQTWASGGAVQSMGLRVRKHVDVRWTNYGDSARRARYSTRASNSEVLGSFWLPESAHLIPLIPFTTLFSPPEYCIVQEGQDGESHQSICHLMFKHRSWTFAQLQCVCWAACWRRLMRWVADQCRVSSRVQWSSNLMADTRVLLSQKVGLPDLGSDVSVESDRRRHSHTWPIGMGSSSHQLRIPCLGVASSLDHDYYL